MFVIACLYLGQWKVTGTVQYPNTVMMLIIVGGNVILSVLFIASGPYSDMWFSPTAYKEEEKKTILLSQCQMD